MQRASQCKLGSGYPCDALSPSKYKLTMHAAAPNTFACIYTLSPWRHGHTGTPTTHNPPTTHHTHTHTPCSMRDWMKATAWSFTLPAPPACLPLPLPFPLLLPLGVSPAAAADAAAGSWGACPLCLVPGACAPSASPSAFRFPACPHVAHAASHRCLVGAQRGTCEIEWQERDVLLSHAPKASIGPSVAWPRHGHDRACPPSLGPQTSTWQTAQVTKRQGGRGYGGKLEERVEESCAYFTQQQAKSGAGTAW